MEKIGHFIGDKYRNVASGFMGVLKESKFYEEGVLTPEEFLKAGDYLTIKCPTWKWCGNKSQIKPADYLPKEKQFLQTTVPCINRVKNFDKATQYKENIVENDWCSTDFESFKGKNDEQIKDFDIENLDNKNQVVINQMDNYMDIEVFDEKDNNEKTEKTDDFLVVEVVDDNVIKSRTYDVTISYDYYYRVPRLWLIGYSETGNPLTSDEIKEDIMIDYIDKTVTIEKHPNTGVNSLSIHPCKHSLLLKAMIQQFEKNGKKLEVEKSVILFLKFLSSVVPTIKYDFTLDVDF